MTEPSRCHAGRWLATACAVLAVAACSGSQAATAEPPHPPESDVTNPVEVFFRDSTGFSVEPVYSQCDNHGHRVFASRHPIDFRVLDDPSCPGAPSR